MGKTIAIGSTLTWVEKTEVRKQAGQQLQVPGKTPVHFFALKWLRFALMLLSELANKEIC